MNKDFCKNCGIKLQRDALSSVLGGQKKYQEFEDGNYCEKCAKLRVESRRKKLN